MYIRKRQDIYRERNLLLHTLLFGGSTDKIPHNYPKDNYADKSHVDIEKSPVTRRGLMISSLTLFNGGIGGIAAMEGELVAAVTLVHEGAHDEVDFASL